MFDRAEGSGTYPSCADCVPSRSINTRQSENSQSLALHLSHWLWAEKEATRTLVVHGWGDGRRAV